MTRDGTSTSPPGLPCLAAVTPTMRQLREAYGFDSLKDRLDLASLACRRACGPRALDVGTGSGWMARVMMAEGWEVVALDVASAAVERTRSAMVPCVDSVGGTVLFVSADAAMLPFADGTFDAVFAFDAIHHARDCRAVVGEMVRVCSPSGVMAVGEMNAEGLRVTDEIHRQRGERHETNACRVDVVYQMLAEVCGEVEQVDQAFETLFLARPPRRQNARSLGVNVPCGALRRRRDADARCL